MQKIKLYNAHCCGEIGDVVLAIDDLNFKSPKQGSVELFKDQYWRNFFLNEPRGGVFKHCNIIVKPSDPNANAGFIIMEPEDNPPMSGSNCICVTTVLLEGNARVIFVTAVRTCLDVIVGDAGLFVEVCKPSASK